MLERLLDAFARWRCGSGHHATLVWLTARERFVPITNQPIEFMYATGFMQRFALWNGWCPRCGQAVEWADHDPTRYMRDGDQLAAHDARNEYRRRVLSEGHERVTPQQEIFTMNTPRLTTELFLNALTQTDVIANEPLGSSARTLAAITDPADPSMPDNALVRFEGQWCRWGDLMLADRKAYLLGDEYPY